MQTIRRGNRGRRWVCGREYCVLCMLGRCWNSWTPQRWKSIHIRIHIFEVLCKKTTPCLWNDSLLPSKTHTRIRIHMWREYWGSRERQKKDERNVCIYICMCICVCVCVCVCAVAVLCYVNIQTHVHIYTFEVFFCQKSYTMFMEWYFTIFKYTCKNTS